MGEGERWSKLREQQRQSMETRERGYFEGVLWSFPVMEGELRLGSWCQERLRFKQGMDSGAFWMLGINTELN